MYNNIIQFIKSLFGVRMNKIDKEEVGRKILEVLGKKTNQPKVCSSCGHTQWIVNGDILMMNQYTGQGIALGGGKYPFFTITCERCGHSMMFNAIYAGVLNNKGEIVND